MLHEKKQKDKIDLIIETGEFLSYATDNSFAATLKFLSREKLGSFTKTYLEEIKSALDQFEEKSEPTKRQDGKNLASNQTE